MIVVLLILSMEQDHTTALFQLLVLGLKWDGIYQIKYFLMWVLVQFLVFLDFNQAYMLHASMIDGI